LALHVIAEAQKAGGTCAIVDAEHALDPGYAKKLGVNVEDLLIAQPDAGEQALEITDTLVRSGALDVLVIDSVAALVPRAELEGEMGDTHVGLQARLMSQALRKLTISKMGELLDLGVAANIVDKSGAWFSYGEERLGQGRENSKAHLRDNPHLAEEIEAKIRANAGLIADDMLTGIDKKEDDAVETLDTKAKPEQEGAKKAG